MLPAGDNQLVQIVNAATADAARRSGDWLKCRPGCTQCCIGVFPISQLDALRLRHGLANLETGQLDEDDPSFAGFANDEPCPVLDPTTGTCDLYSARPMTCRVFGLPIRSTDGIGVCELCFDGASDSEILDGELQTGWTSLEGSLNTEAEQASGRKGSTVVAFALLA